MDARLMGGSSAETIVLSRIRLNRYRTVSGSERDATTQVESTIRSLSLPVLTRPPSRSGYGAACASIILPQARRSPETYDRPDDADETRARSRVHPSAAWSLLIHFAARVDTRHLLRPVTPATHSSSAPR